MGRFIAPEWQQGYRYISLAQGVAAVRTERPIPILMTHDTAGPGGKADFCVLSRLAMLVNTGKERLWFHECGSRSHTYHPWGIENNAKMPSGDLLVSVTTVPLVEGGGFLVRTRFVNTTSQTLPLAVSFVVGGLGFVEDPRMVTEFSEASGDVLSVHDNAISIFNEKMREPKIHATICCDRQWDVRVIDFEDVFDKGRHPVIAPLALTTVPMGILMPGEETTAYICLAYGNDEARARIQAVELAGRAETEHSRTEDHFSSLLGRTNIETPSRYLNGAFEAAVCDLEYTWWEGLGWMEIPSYWNGFFHQTRTQGAVCIGQLDRARQCALASGLKTDEAGRIPLLTMNGGTWGLQFDWTHHYILGLDYFHRTSGDTETLRTLWPHLQRAYDRFFRENTVHDGLILSWGEMQLEFQEDDIRTWYRGSSPTIAGVMVNEKMSGFAGALGLSDEEQEFRERAARGKASLRAELWDERLGRFIYWIDEDGVKHTESQHHTYSWPANFEITDLLDSHTSLRHLRETLISPRDIVYNSNQFPEDRLSCLGAQESIAVTGSVAVAFGRIGDADTCSRILEGASKCIMDEPHEGLVPEQAQIDFQSYFSGSAAHFAWGVVEGLFGIRWDVPAGLLKLEPSLPSAWPQASITLDNLTWSVEQQTGFWRGRVLTDRCIKRRFKIPLPPCEIESCCVNGKPHKYSVEPGIAGIFLIVTTAEEVETDIAVNYLPAPVHLLFEPDVAEGDLLTVRYDGCEVLEAIDRSHVGEKVTVSGDSVEIRLKTDTAGLKPTVFLRCQCGGTEFYHPLDLRVHEKLEVTPASDALKTEDGYAVEVGLTNWERQPTNGPLSLQLLDREAGETAELRKSETHKLRLPIGDGLLRKLSPGWNSALIKLPSGENRALNFKLVQPFVDSAALRADLSGRLAHIDLSESYSHSFDEFMALKEDLLDRAIAPDRPGPRFLSEILSDQKEISDPGTGLSFRVDGRRLILAAHGTDAEVPINAPAEKVYVLTVSCLGTEDTYSQVGRLGVAYENGTNEEVALTIPGNINWGYYYRGWESSLKWYDGLAIVYPGTVLDILEVQLDPKKTLKELYLATCGRRPVIGILGVTLLRSPRT